MDSLVATTALLDGVTPMLYAFGIGLILLETVVMVVRDLPRDKKSRWLGVKCGVLAFGTEGILQATVLLALHFWVWEHRLFDLGFTPFAWLLCFVINDAMFYVSHRAQHRCRLLWAVHVVHHSPKHYDLTTGIRGSALGTLASFPFVLWIPLVGIHPVMFLVADKLFKFWGLAYHTESIGKLGWLDRIFVTPSNHRVHHATNPQYIDRNYGGLWVGFDRLLGTFEPEVEEPRYGLVKDWHGYGLIDCQVHEFRDLWRDMRGADSVADALRYAVMPPGWAPSTAVSSRTASQASTTSPS